MESYKNIFGAALLLAGTGMANAESDGPASFLVTPECAENALLEVFEEPFEIIHGEGGVGGFRRRPNEESGVTTNVSSIVNIAPNGNLASINVQVDLSNSSTGVDYTSASLRDYRTVSQGKLTINGNGSKLADTVSRAFNDKLDTALRKCSLIGSMSYPPFNIG